MTPDLYPHHLDSPDCDHTPCVWCGECHAYGCLASYSPCSSALRSVGLPTFTDLLDSAYVNLDGYIPEES